MSNKPALNLGAWRRMDGTEGGKILRLPANHLVTHGVAVGMTGSGENRIFNRARRRGSQCRCADIIIDVKGDLPNLLLTFPSFDPGLLAPWVEAGGKAILLPAWN